MPPRSHLIKDIWIISSFDLDVPSSPRSFGQTVEARVVNGKAGPACKSGPKKLEDLEAEGKLAMDRLEDIANYMGDYRDIVEEYAVRGRFLFFSRRGVSKAPDEWECIAGAVLVTGNISKPRDLVACGLYAEFCTFYI